LIYLRGGTWAREGKGKRYLVEGEDPVELLPRDGLRDGDLPLEVVAGDDLRRVAPDLVVAEGPGWESRGGVRLATAADLGLAAWVEEEGQPVG
jgi:hypothetical protein